MRRGDHCGDSGHLVLLFSSSCARVDVTGPTVSDGVVDIDADRPALLLGDCPSSPVGAGEQGRPH